MNLSERAKAIFEAVRRTPARVPEHVTLAPHRVDELTKLGTTLTKDSRYFLIRVNEMFLASEREWLKTYYPMVLFGSGFLYDGQEADVPFVIGPTTLMPNVDKGTGDILFRNTRVAGVHPYRGGRLCLSVILYRVTKQDIARQVLNMVENLAKAVDFGTATGVYTKVAGALLDGVETLAGLEGTQPLLGHRIELDPDAGDRLDPGYFALVDMPEEQLKRYELRVRDDRLVHGPNFADAQPFRAADYVLYSIASGDDRSDVDKLPFHDLRLRVTREAAVPTEEGLESAVANMLSLYQTLLLSPDLITGHARGLAKEFAREMELTHKDAVNIAAMGKEEKDGVDPLKAIRKEALHLLKPS